MDYDGEQLEPDHETLVRVIQAVLEEFPECREEAQRILNAENN